ncbi:inositol 5-phosphatase [Anaeramoeba ignava]|uniref:Inositol 5-phosphatase n=1 Tax=Anaeramoeba ignava TaxID=1746090 RepID=A0A9Q0RA88_ANAIG|nr:inositol 5-phosphatase [Anaeramoeba ignava]
MNINEFTREGFLKKRGGSYKSWKKRWCSLHENKLFYYEKQEHSNMKNHIPKGFIYLEDCSISVKSLEKNQFEICVRDKKRKYLIEANSNDEMMEWILAIFIHRDQYYFAQIGAMTPTRDENYRRNSFNLPQIFNVEQFVTFEVQKIEKTKKKPFRCFVISKEDGTIGIGKGNMKKRSKTVTKAITKSGNTFGSLQDAFQFYQKFNPENLIRFERAVSDKTKIRLMWDVKGHFNDYIFTSGVARERFINEITQIKVQCLGKKELALLYENIKIKLFIGTWNIGSAAPPDDLSDWIPNNQDIDIFAIATQECDYSPRQGYSNTQDDWTVTLSMHLGTKYTLIAKQSLMGIKLHVFIKEIYIKHVHCIQTETKATGVAGVVGNKGACGVAFQLHDSSFCFVGSHLAAREERIAIRAENYRDIIGGLHFGIPGVDITEQFQYLFWFGDLNYRCEYPFDVGVELGMKKDYQKLLEKDQLKREMSQGKVFQGFSEGKIDFPPSYRYTRGEVNIFSDQPQILVLPEAR